MAIKITERTIFGGSTIFESLSAETIAQAIKEIGEKPNLSGANLSGADLSGADLYRANLYRANLSGADLYRANLTGANLYGANLSGADLYRANLTGANLYGANLYGADLYRANLTGANLTGANLSGARISWQSHGCISEILRRDAGEDIQKRMVAGLILVSGDWCWDKFLSLEITPDIREWALTSLSGWAWAGDADVPRLLTEWMESKGIDRPIRPEIEVKQEGGVKS